MPSNVQVKVNTVQPITRGNFNLIEVTGYDHTNNKGFKKSFFEEKKGGGRTKAAEVADTLTKDDWVEFVLDDTSYANVQTLKKIAEPAGGGGAPSQGGGGGRSSGGGGGDKMSKAEWAEKDRKREASIARNSSLKAAVEFMKVMGKVPKKDNVELCLDVARRFEDYLSLDNKQPGDEQGEDEAPPSTSGEDQTGATQDDDIPF